MVKRFITLCETISCRFLHTPHLHADMLTITNLQVISTTKTQDGIASNAIGKSVLPCHLPCARCYYCWLLADCSFMMSFCAVPTKADGMDVVKRGNMRKNRCPVYTLSCRSSTSAILASWVVFSLSKFAFADICSISQRSCLQVQLEEW